MKERHVLVKDMKKIEFKRGEILARKGDIVLLKTPFESNHTYIFTVFIPIEGYHICNTFYEEEAFEVFKKYTKD